MSSLKKHSPSNQSEQIGDYVSIHLRGSKWYVNYMENGHQRRKSLKTTSKKQARLKAIKIENRILSGEKTPRKDVLAKELVQVYLDHIQGGTLAAKTKQKYVRVLSFVLQEADKLKGANEFDFSYLDRFRKKRLQEVSASTTYDESMIILQMTKFGVLRKLISSNPLAGYKIKEPKPKPQPCWTREEGEQIIANTTTTVYQVAFYLLLNIGMRSAELTHLQWDDIDLEQEVFHIREKYWVEDGKEHSWKPKSGDNRSVPMTPKVYRELQKLTRRDKWVFHSPASHKYPDGNHRMTESRLLKALKPVLKKLSLEGKIHTFRHTFISVALLNGIPEATVKNWVGHVDAEIIQRYTHIADQISQQQMLALAAKLDSQTSEDAEKQ